MHSYVLSCKLVPYGSPPAREAIRAPGEKDARVPGWLLSCALSDNLIAFQWMEA